MTNSQSHPKTVSETFPSKWLHARDLTGKTTVIIESVTFEKIRNIRTLVEGLEPVVTFHNQPKRLITNKTQCKAIWRIIGSEHYIDWPGNAICLTPGMTNSKDPTIVITTAPNNAQPDQPPPPARPEASAPLSEEVKREIELNPRKAALLNGTPPDDNAAETQFKNLAPEAIKSKRVAAKIVNSLMTAAKTSGWISALTSLEQAMA